MRILIGTDKINGVSNALVKAIFSSTTQLKADNPDMIEVVTDGVEDGKIKIGNTLYDPMYLRLNASTLQYSSALDNYYSGLGKDREDESKVKRIGCLITKDNIGVITSAERTELNQLVGEVGGNYN